MDNREIVKNCRQLIERAKGLSKDKIVEFAREQYKVDAETWQHLWAVPIATMYDYEEIFPVKLEAISEEELLEAIDATIDDALGDEPMAVVPHANILTALPPKAGNEYDDRIINGIERPTYDAAIVYDEDYLIDMYREHIQEGTQKGYTQEQIDAVYLKDISQHFIHERLHIITNKLIITAPEFERRTSSKGYDEQEQEILQEGILMLRAREGQSDSEVIIDIMANIISEHQPGRTIDEDLKQWLEDRAKTLKRNNITSYYSGKDDSLATSMFTLFPEKFAKWIMIDGCDTKLPNVFISSCDEVLGVGSRIRGSELYAAVGKYFNTQYASTLSGKERDMKQEQLELLGATGLKKEAKPIDKQQLRELATSGQALEEVKICGNIIQKGCQEICQGDKKGECLE